jgi:MFS family permease
MRPQTETLWQCRDFLKLWSAQATSLLGTHLASLAYPLTAVLTLQATSFEMGILQATGAASAALVGLFAGVIADRARRKPLLIIADLGRALLAITIPIAAFFGFLRIWQLYVVGFLAGALNILSDVAGMAFLPSLVEKEQLVEGNSKLSATESAARIAGTGLSGALVQILTAPIAIIIDALSFIFSAAFVLLIRTPEPPPIAGQNRRSVWQEIGEGLSFVYSNPILRPLSQAIAASFFVYFDNHNRFHSLRYPRTSS